jgi:hypothetical protein
MAKARLRDRQSNREVATMNQVLEGELTFVWQSHSSFHSVSVLVFCSFVFVNRWRRSNETFSPKIRIEKVETKRQYLFRYSAYLGQYVHSWTLNPLTP